MQQTPGGPLKAISFIEPLEARIAPATFTVTNTKDDGPGSLRDAIEQANAEEGPDDILFSKTLNGTVKLKSDLPAVTDSVTISGPGASKLIVNGNNHQLFKIVGEGLDVSISGLKLTKGQAANGGAVYINNLDGTVTLSKTVITKNRAIGSITPDPNSAYVVSTPGVGGGVAVLTGSVTIEKSKITGNKAGTLVEFYIYGKTPTQALEPNGSGGGIAVSGSGSLTLKKTVVSGNTAGVGGGIHNGGELNVEEKSTISKNVAKGFYQLGPEGSSLHAGAKGGGVFNSGRLSITDSKINGNQATGAPGGSAYFGAADSRGGTASGGGIFNSEQGIIAIISSRISGNKATGGKGGSASGYPGGGIYSLARGDVGGQDGTGGRGGAAFGGGIFNSTEGIVTVMSSKISGNKAVGGKGGTGGIGLPGEDSDGEYGRRGGRGGQGQQGGAGGAAYGGAISSEGSITIEKSKITGNAAIGGAGGKGGKGGPGGQGADREAPYQTYYGKIPGKPPGAGGRGGKGGKGGIGGAGFEGGIHGDPTLISVEESKQSGNTARDGVNGAKGALGKQGKRGSNKTGDGDPYYL